jgi:hypothetical protein
MTLNATLASRGIGHSLSCFVTLVKVKTYGDKALFI